ncbi:MAG TPA: ketoacyl-ACP synthase III [Planctomycetaceae bacterium]|nr:ketoacyl-ACP synthase III [Planctomycetaceae bacterium]
MTEAKARIAAIRSALPARAVSSEALAQEFPEWGVEKIVAKTGIRNRHIAAADECSSDLAVAAAKKLFDDGLCSPHEIDFLLLCTQSPDYFLPSTACLVQDRLGLPTTCGALDFNLGCSGFVYGLSLAKGLMETGAAKTVLLIAAETYSKFLNPQDKSVRTIFGDGAAATLLRAGPAEREPIGSFVFATDGSGAKNLIVKAGGMRQRTTPATEATVDQWLYMNGPEIFNFTLRAVPELVDAVLGRSGLSLNDVDRFVFHQANQFMLDSLRKRVGIPVERFCVELEQVGNTVSATIPMVLEAALRDGRIVPGQRVMLVGFGVGYSSAGCLVEL